MARRNWERIVLFFGYPPDIRRVIYTTNAIESLNMGLREVAKNRGSFPSNDGVNKAVLSSTAEYQPKMDDATIRDWKAALLS